MKRNILFNIAKIFIFLILIFTNLDAEIYLKDNLKKAKKGDFIVTSQSKSYTLLHIYDKKEDQLTLEEISIPATQLCLPNHSWKAWVQNGALHHTSWVMFTIDLQTGVIQKFYSFSKGGWHQKADADSFLSTLLNLRLEKIPDIDRKKVGLAPLDGRPDRRAFWQPRLIFDGQIQTGVSFDAWQTRWPKDTTELSGRFIEIYTPEANTHYPAYFPYWLQISGAIGKAKVRIIDSGTDLVSPRPPLP